MVIRSIDFDRWRYDVPSSELMEYDGAHVIPRLIEDEDMSFYTSYYHRRPP